MAERLQPLQTSKSFTRLETAPAKDPLSRSRASTLQGPPVPSILDPLKQKLAPGSEDGHDDGDVFTTQEDAGEASAPEPGLPDTFEELPIEIRSLTERYDPDTAFHRVLY
jgi:hypothetical protein